LTILFVDTTYDICLGLLGDDLKWIEIRTQKGQRASAVLQNQVYGICKEHEIFPADLKGIISVAGPGFYTGLRLSQGFADIFKVFGVPSMSFYTYEIPRWCGHEKGVWMTKAYRGEWFFHEWDGNYTENILVATTKVEEHLKHYDHVFIHSETAIEALPKNFSSTLKLLEERPEQIFSEVVKKSLVRESYYFRAPEDEFRTNP
jgi:tRNA threonylcarbamoyladenosine biosynthesis protein TsaB